MFVADSRELSERSLISNRDICSAVYTGDEPLAVLLLLFQSGSPEQLL